jgi:hypothetical protein
MSERQLLSSVVNRALRSVHTDEPHEWLGICPPPCTTVHTLTDAAPYHEEEAPIFVLQPRKEPVPGSSIGIVVCGHSRLVAVGETMPLVGRLTPALAKMTLEAVLTADLPATIREICTNTPYDATNVRLPLDVRDNALHMDVDRLSDEDVAVGMLCIF